MPRRLIICLVGVLTAVAALDLVFAPPLDRAQDLSPEILDRHGAPVHAFTTGEGRWRYETSVEDIDPVFIERLIAIEDKRFRNHWGVDPLAVARASRSALRSGEITSGASTITMQTARLLEPRPRNIVSKGIEMVRAVQIERRLSKDQILELYLTLAPYGGNLEGVRAASLSYFGKEPLHLTDAEQALLLALPQAPEARRPDLKPENANHARQALLDKLVEKSLLAKSRADEAADAPLPKQRRARKHIAYHVSRDLAERSEAGRIFSALDRQLQEHAEAIVKTQADGLDDGATISMIIVENETRSVRALVGSSGLDIDGGWINLTGAVRSPGSTLKPFIYAMAFEDGLASPATVIDDMPRSFGGYTPENFDRTFRGEVRVREALQHSLNLPAVRALDRVGVERFAGALRFAGVNLRQPKTAESERSLALALGGAGITAQDIALLYAGLANGGEIAPLQWTQSEAAPDGYRLMSEKTAARISNILNDAPSLQGRAPAKLSDGALRVAYKTGTSYGYRDAWAAGHGGGYTVVVWVGRADGAPRMGETGRKAAAPILFDVFDMLERNGARKDETTEPYEDDDAPFALASFGGVQSKPPEIVFPRHGVELYLARERGFSLAARGGAADYRWYVNGEPVTTETTSGRAVWKPEKGGFYSVTVIDADGKSARAKVRVRS